MPILGIDYGKCIGCDACVIVCPARLFGKDRKEETTVFQDPKGRCILCGHCVAGCPESAILHEDMGESITFEGVERPGTIISFDSLCNLFQAHRSIRRYRKEKVPTNVLQKVFDAMQYAPTARNLRSQNFSILSDEKRIKMLSDAVQKELLGIPQVRTLYGDVFSRIEKEFKSPIYYDAPHVVFVFSEMGMGYESSDIAIMITYARLAAQSLSLGTCWNGWTDAAIRLNPKIGALAGIRGSKVGVFTVGYPAVKFYRSAPRLRKAVEGLD